MERQGFSQAPLVGMASGVQQQPSAITKTIGFARGISGGALVTIIVVCGLQAAMPAGAKPSDLIGSFWGLTNAAQQDAERVAQVKTAHDIADAQAKAAANWAIEQEAARQQLESIKGSLAAKENAAIWLDAACMSGGVATAIWGRDARGYANTVSQACPEAAKLRAEIVAETAEAVRLGSALNQRNRPVPNPYLSATAPLRK